MQAITIAIGKNGIKFFTQQLVVKELIQKLSGLKPPDREIKIDKIKVGLNSADDIDITLTQGKLNNFTPVFQGVSQQANGVFRLQLGENSFSAQYNWYESYKYTICYTIPDPPYGIDCNNPTDESNTFNYTPGFSNFTVTVPLRFQYNDQKKEWDVVALDSKANPPAAQANIPSRSIIQTEHQECFTWHVSDATATAISSIDFGTPVSQLIQGIVASIPAAGDLGNGIMYDFSLGDSGLAFPNNDGIQMGVKGGASYKGTAFSGDTPPKLPLPTPPSDTDQHHHLNMYVSNYEVDALHWAFFKAGELDTIVNPTDIPEPNSLKVATYVNLEKSLKPYQAFAMQAHISPIAAPVTVFESVWEFTKEVIAVLRQKLPANLSDFLDGIQGNAYVSKPALEDYMKDADVKPEYFKIIEDAAQRMGMVVTSKLNFDLVIQNGKDQKPDIKFSLARTDVLTKLRLGIGGNNAQTMQYDFLNVNFNAAFISSTVPGFSGANFGNIVWPVGGEPRYVQVLAEMGKMGVPLPIMKDFQFDFTNAELSIQEGYVSILASVLYKS